MNKKLQLSREGLNSPKSKLQKNTNEQSDAKNSVAQKMLSYLEDLIASLLEAKIKTNMRSKVDKILSMAKKTKI